MARVDIEQIQRDAKFNPEKCMKCKFRNEAQSNNIGSTVRLPNGKTTRVYCDYAYIMNSTCLKPISPTKSIDMRGDDYNNCNYFIEGDKIERDVTITILGVQNDENKII